MRYAWTYPGRWMGLALVAIALSGCAARGPMPGEIDATKSEQGAANETKVELVQDQAPQDAAPKLDVAATEVADPANRTLELRGRVETDVLMADQSARSKAILGNVLNTVGFRRARLGAFGTFGEQLHWVSEFEFAGGQVAFKDVYLAMEKLPLVGEIGVGHFREPFSLEGQTSSNYFPVMERSSINALDPGRNWGVKLHRYSDDERVTLTAGAYKSGTDRTGADTGDGNDMAYTFRLTGLPWHDEPSEGRRLFHVGAAFSQRYPKNDTITFNQAARSTLLQTEDDPLTPFVPNISIPASQNQLYNLQAALVLGSLSCQAEWNATWIDQLGRPPVFLRGSYVLLSYFLTGEHRQYEPKLGTFGQTQIHAPFFLAKGKRDVGGSGAWEIVFRFDYLDFTSPNLAPNAGGLKIGNKLAAGLFGINWYLHDNVRLMFNYIHAVPVDPNFGPSRADAFFLRAAFFW